MFKKNMLGVLVEYGGVVLSVLRNCGKVPMLPIPNSDPALIVMVNNLAKCNPWYKYMSDAQSVWDQFLSVNTRGFSY